MSDLREHISGILSEWPEHNRVDEHETVLDLILAAVEKDRGDEA